MSRSFKKAIITISKKLRDSAHSVVRRNVKQQLKCMDPEFPEDDDIARIEADTREMGLEEWGTKMGMEFEDILANHTNNYKIKEY